MSACKATREELLAAMQDYWFKHILADLDYEVKGGTWENPRWAWQDHEWFKMGVVTKKQCQRWFDKENKKWDKKNRFFPNDSETYGEIPDDMAAAVLDFFNPGLGELVNISKGKV